MQIEPRNKEPLGDLSFGPDKKQPLGGINPYSHHFDDIGDHFKNLLIEHARLNPNSNILDVGCGTGRLAKSLHDYLENGSYYGIDANKRYIDYCRSNYLNSNFHFDHLNVQNDEYNKDATIAAYDSRFPFKDATFDLSVAIALFNHLDIKSILRYIAELSRVLKPKGILFFTALILNPQSVEVINQRDKPPFKFSYRTDNSWHEYQSRPLINVAVPEAGIRRQLINCKMMIKEPIRFGEWSESKLALTGHDVVTAIKGQWY
ncbi:class I SAM-dependent methyltransferase [bacterium]|nr:class I SAM-dependent methyltransferase [bacterium]